jgi:tetratricopeptide (TPR) repeat protein
MATESQERNPYVGPRPFERQDRDLFFGRDGEASELLSLVIAHRMLLLYAQSGAGKTSLINAGLIPLLEEEGFEVLPLARVQGLIPEDIQPEEIPNLYVFNTLMSWVEDEADTRRLAQMSIADFLKQRERPIDEEGLPAPCVVIFDQFEELFAFYQERWQDREGFFEQVRDALKGDPLLRVVFVIREDHIAQLDPYAPLLPEKLRTRFRLERLRKRVALSAVTGPLAETKRSFTEGVAEQLVGELLKARVQSATGETVVVAGEFVEPVQLQVVCQSLWRDLPPDVTVINQDHLQAFGDVNQALSGFYERCIERAAQESGIKEGDLRSWFEDILITPAGTRGTVYRGREETGGIRNPAVDVLEGLHLIKGEWRAGAHWYELTHDRFIGPIQKSNEAWRTARKKRWLRIGIGVAVVLVLFVVGITALQAIISKREIAQERATATAAAQGTGIAAAQARATIAAQETAAAQADATVAAQETAAAQAKATVAAQETAAAQAKATVAAEETAAAQAEETAIAQETAAAQAKATIATQETAAAQIEAAATARAQKEAEALSFLADADQSISQGDYDQAIHDCTRAIELAPDLAAAYYKRGFVYTYHLDEYEKAIADYDRAIELDPKHKWAYGNKSYALRELGRYDEALAVLDQVIRLFPEYVWAYNERGRVYSDLGEYEQAIEDYDKAIELDPEYKYAYAHKGSDLRKLGRYDEALAALDQAIQLDPEYAWPYTERGNVYSERGEYDRAIEEYDKAIELYPEYKWAYGNKGYALRKLGRYDEALAALDRAIELDPEYADAYLDRGLAYEQLGEQEKAIADLEKFLNLSKDESLRSQVEEHLKVLREQ